MKANDYSAVNGWTGLWRWFLICALLLTAAQSVGAAIVLHSLGTGENVKIVSAALLLVAGVSAGVAIALWRATVLTWQHWVIALLLAVPGAIDLLT